MAIAEQIPTQMPTSNRPMNAGASMDDNTSRLDGAAKVTGLAKYGKDMLLPNALYVAFIRCPFGAADLAESDLSAAKASPGVIETEITGKEGQYHGQPVGYVAADSPLALKRGLRAVKVKWKRKAVKTRIVDAIGDAPSPNDETKNAFAGAELTHEAVYTTPIQTHSSLETHGGVVDHRGDRATVYASTQGTSSVRDGLGKALALAESEFEVVCEYVGGGFGSKFGPGKEITQAAKIGAKHKRPVHLFCDRAEEHLDTGNRPSSRTLVRVAFKKDGTVTGGEVVTWGGVGVGHGGGGASVPSGRYHLSSLKKSHTDVNTNGGGPRAFRAPGHPQGAFAEELMLDEIAAKAGLDPLELRKRLVNSDVHREMFDLGAKLIGWQERTPNGSQTKVMRIGYGMGSTSWGSPGPGGAAEVVINRDGSVESRTGTQDIGTGQRTTMGIVTAAALGVPLAMVNVRIGRSTLPPGPGSGGSVTSPMTAPTMTAAAEDAREKLLEHVSKQAKAKPGDLTIKDGAIFGAGGKPLMAWKAACATLPPEGIVGTSNGKKPEAGTGGSQGAQFVKLAVDTETGVVHLRHVVAIQSCGKVICRKTAESQIIGGVIQGLSYALFENQILDRNLGTMVNPDLEMYKILGSMDMPHIEPVLWAKGQTGVKSLGEPPTVPTAGATACAVFNAIGRPVRDLPLTPDKILAALEGGAA